MQAFGGRDVRRDAGKGGVRLGGGMLGEERGVRVAALVVAAPPQRLLLLMHDLRAQRPRLLRASLPPDARARIRRTPGRTSRLVLGIAVADTVVAPRRGAPRAVLRMRRARAADVALTIAALTIAGGLPRRVAELSSRFPAVVARVSAAASLLSLRHPPVLAARAPLRCPRRLAAARLAAHLLAPQLRERRDRRDRLGAPLRLVPAHLAARERLHRLDSLALCLPLGGSLRARVLFAAVAARAVAPRVGAQPTARPPRPARARAPARAVLVVHLVGVGHRRVEADVRLVTPEVGDAALALDAHAL